MAYEIRDNSGSLFKNDKKQEGDNKPNYTGQVMINGVEMWISAWLKDGPNGKWMSLSFKPKEQQQAAPSRPAPASADFEDDIPFTYVGKDRMF